MNYACVDYLVSDTSACTGIFQLSQAPFESARVVAVLFHTRVSGLSSSHSSLFRTKGTSRDYRDIFILCKVSFPKVEE